MDLTPGILSGMRVVEVSAFVAAPLGMLRSTCRTAAASRNFLGTHRYLPKNDRCFVY